MGQTCQNIFQIYVGKILTLMKYTNYSKTRTNNNEILGIASPSVKSLLYLQKSAQKFAFCFQIKSQSPYILKLAIPCLLPTVSKQYHFRRVLELEHFPRSLRTSCFIYILQHDLCTHFIPSFPVLLGRVSSLKKEGSPKFWSCIGAQHLFNYVSIAPSTASGGKKDQQLLNNGT